MNENYFNNLNCCDCLRVALKSGFTYYLEGRVSSKAGMNIVEDLAKFDEFDQAYGQIHISN